MERQTTTRPAAELLWDLASSPDWVAEGFLRYEGLPATGDRRQWLDRAEKVLDDVGSEHLQEYLRQVARAERLLKKLPKPADAAVEGLLRRADQEIGDGPQERLRQAELALATGQISVPDFEDFMGELERIDEAVGWLKDFKVKTPPAESFRDAKGLPRAPNLAALYETIRAALYRGSFPLRDLVDHLDDLRHHGRQHVFLLQLDPEHQDYLQDLADPGDWRRRFPELDREGCLIASEREGGDGRPRFLWKPERPEIAAVRINDESLTIRWVEARSWLQPNPHNPDKPTPRKQRAVNFFCLDLETGAAELRLQKFVHKPQQELRRSVAAYRELLGRLVKLERFSPVLLEPAARRFLSSSQVGVKSWKVEMPGGEILGGRGGGPGLFRNIFLVFQKYFTLDLQGDWRPPDGEGAPLAIRLDGRMDELFLSREADSGVLARLLGELRGLGEPMRRARQTDPRLIARTTMLSKLSQALEKTGRREIPYSYLNKLAAATGFKARQYIAAIEKGAVGFEDLLGVIYRVRCPQTRSPVRQAGKIREFDRFRKIPKTLGCDHKGRRRRHQTAGHILIRFPDYKVQPPDPRRLWPLLWLVGEITATTAVFAYISTLDVTLWFDVPIVVAFGLALVTLTSLVLTAIGIDRWAEAFDELRKLFSFFYGGLQGLAESVLGQVWGALRKLWRR